MAAETRVYFKDNTELWCLFEEHGTLMTLAPSAGYWNPDSDHVYLVASGMLKVYITDEDGNENFLWILGRGSLISMFSSRIQKRMYILKRTSVFALSKDMLPELFKKNRGYFDAFMAQIYDRYDDHLLKTMAKNSKDVTTRLCGLLYELAVNVDGNAKRVRLENYLSRQDMAYYLGVHAGTVSRSLAQLEAEGIISRLPGRALVVEDMELLRKRALLEAER